MRLDTKFRTVHIWDPTFFFVIKRGTLNNIYLSEGGGGWKTKSLIRIQNFH
jgi:hypothetical protein